MRFLNIGGATGILEQNGKRMLLDPWLDDGIYHGAGYHYPPITLGPADIGPLDYVYISHIHEDHCSAGTIRHLDRSAEVIIADRRPNFVLSFLESHGFDFAKVHLIAPQQPQEIAPGLVVDMLTADPDHEYARLIDSALLLRWDGEVVYNANDCAPYEGGLQYIEQTYPQVDLAMLPYAGGSGYPGCYANLTHDEKLAERERIFTGRLNDFLDTVERLQPTWAAPFADQYVIAGSRSHLNDYIPHPPGYGVVADLMAERGLGDLGVFLNPGQTFDTKTGGKSPDEPFYRHTEQDRDAYLSTLKDVTYDHERLDLDLGVPLGRLLQSARDRMWQQQQRIEWFSEWTYVIDVVDRHERYLLPLDRPEMESVPTDQLPDAPYLRIGAPATLLALMLIGHVSWNVADAALFLDYERVPNTYDTKVHAYINYLRL